MVKSGFIRDPSSLLMSVIRTLEDHSDSRHRDAEREKLEEAFADVDRKLDKAVEANYEEISVTIRRFSDINSGISNCRTRMTEVREKLGQCKQLLHCRQDELRGLWIDGIEYKKEVTLLEQVEKIRAAPMEVDKLMYEGEWTQCVQKITEALNWCNNDLALVGALHDLRAEIQAKHQIVYEKLIAELQRLIYGHHNKTEITESLQKMKKFAHAIECLGKTDAATEEIRNRIDTELSGIINRETTHVSDKEYLKEEEVQSSKILSELLDNIYVQFRSVARMHQTLLESLSPKTKRPYTIVDVWLKIQTVLKFLLVEYLEEDISGSFNRLSTIGVDLGAKRKHKLFRFDASGHAISMNTYLREKRQENDNSSETYFSAVPVCKTSARNITGIYRSLSSFIAEIEKEIDIEPGRHIALYTFVVEHIEKTFIKQLGHDVSSELDAATKVTDPLKVIADSAHQKYAGSLSPILQSALVVFRQVEDLVDVLLQLDEYTETFFIMICTVLQKFYQSINEPLQNLVTPEDQDILSNQLTNNADLRKLIQGSPIWRRAFGISVKSDSNKAAQVMLKAEAEMITDMLKDKEISRQTIIEDLTDMKAVANLHESLEWLTNKLRKTFGLLTSHGQDSDVLMQLNQILGRFQSLSENCLMYLHLEQRVRCFLFLAPLFKGAKFNVGNSDALETDVEVERLETELKQIEDVLQGSLQPQKYRFVFEGLGQQLRTLLMQGARKMTKISESGVKKICRNIFTIQQALTNITMNREPALDQARQYFELLYQRPEGLVASVEESGPRYTFDDYMVALALSYRSHGELSIGDQSKHKQLEQRLSDVCKSRVSDDNDKTVDDYDF